MHLIIGLGNPGEKYRNTKHNAGFLALERLAAELDFGPPARFGRSLTSKGRLEGRPVVLAWPQTYMNLSGEAAREMAAFYKAPAENILVVHDEMDLAPGLIKLSRGGGPAGHNGLVSLIRHLPEGFDRLKVGIGRPSKNAFLVAAADYVLAPFHADDWPAVDEALTKAVAAARRWLIDGLAKAQNWVNQKPKPADGSDSSYGVLV